LSPEAWFWPKDLNQCVLAPSSSLQSANLYFPISDLLDSMVQWATGIMPIRFAPDKDKPSVAAEIPLQKPLPDYDLDEVEQPTPRDIDGILVSQGFRDLVDDARGILTELVANPPPLPDGSHFVDLGLTGGIPQFEIAQLTGAICPGDDVYRPGLWIVLKEEKAPPNKPLQETVLQHAKAIVAELVKRLAL
jgi:hypothetical protein